MLASFSSLRLELAIPLAKAVEDSRELFWLASLAPLFVLPVTGLVAGVLHAAGVWTAEGLDWADYLLVAVFVVVLDLFAAASQLAIRLRSYGILSRIPVLQTVGTLTAQVGLGAAGLGRGLFVGGLIGRSLGIVGLMRSCDVRVVQSPGRSKAVRLLKEYWRFPAIFAPAGLVNVLGSSLAVLMLPWFFGFGPAGLFAMATRVAGVPAVILSESAGKVFLGEFARTSTRAASLRAFIRWSGVLLLLAVAVSAAIWILAPLVLPWLLGDDWTGTAQLAQYTGVMAGAAIFASPVQHVWTVRQRGLMQLSWNLLRLGATAGVIWLGAKGGDSLAQVIATLAIATTAVYVLGWFGCLWAAARPTAGTSGSAQTSAAAIAIPPERSEVWK